MAMSRGSSVDVFKYEDLTPQLIKKYNYFALEPKQYNQQSIYSSFKFLETSFRKPAFSLTNLLTDEEIQEKKRQFARGENIANINSEREESKMTMIGMWK